MVIITSIIVLLLEAPRLMLENFSEIGTRIDQGPEFSSEVKQLIDVIVTMFIVFSLEIGVPRIPQETRSRYQKNHTLSSTE